MSVYPPDVMTGKVALSLTTALLVAACSAAGPTAPSATSNAVTVAPETEPAGATVAPGTEPPGPSADLEHPIGVIAIGHSALTGEGTAGPAEPNPSASWATGTLPSVNSLYLRLVESVPETEGHASNKAEGGASAFNLVLQAKLALAEVPAPRLAIIDTIDDDIQCDASNVAQVGKWISDAVTYIHETSPNTKILVVDQPSRPNVGFVKSVVAKFPLMKATSFTWDDACSFYDAAGKLNEAAFQKLTDAIDAYEAEQSRVCKLVPNCFDDGGVRRAYVDTIETYSPDFNHFNTLGQATQAELLWPVVQRILGL